MRKKTVPEKPKVIKMIRRAVSILLSVAMLVTVSTACSSEKTAWKVSLPAHVEGAIFGGNSDDSIPVTVIFDADWITKDDNTKYNKKLAAFASLLSVDTYFREKDLQKGTQNRLLFDDLDAGEYTFTTMLTKLGFTDVKHVESFKEKEYLTDTNDSVTLNLAFRNVSEKYDVYVVAIRGCLSAGEWVSVYDPGADTDLYDDITGNHEEWTDRNVLKGFDVAANRAYEIISGFMDSHENAAKNKCVLITGHSRGAAIAEKVGAMFEDGKNIKSYTYAFNSPSVTTDKNAQNYKTIFNIYDSGDYYIDSMPFSNEELYRYGKTIEMDIKNSQNTLEKIKKIKGRDDYVSMTSENKNKHREIFGRLFKDRNSLYEWKSFSEEFDNETSAAKRHDEIAAIISRDTGLGLENYCRISDIGKTDGGKYEITVEYCDEAAFYSTCMILAYGKSASDAVKLLFKNNNDMCDLADFIVDNTKMINGGHLLVNGYAMCQ